MPTNVKKFTLEPFKTLTDHTIYRVVGLTTAYYGPEESDYANGACGLIRQRKYPGYCQLCFVYHTPSSDKYGPNGYTVEFLPLTTKDGERILIEYGHDDLFCIFECGKRGEDATITCCNNGVCIHWEEEN